MRTIALSLAATALLFGCKTAPKPAPCPISLPAANSTKSSVVDSTGSGVLGGTTVSGNYFELSTPPAPPKEDSDQHYVRTHHCKFVWHFTLEDMAKYSPRYWNGSKVVSSLDIQHTGWSEYDCDGVLVNPDDVDGKPWRP